MTPTVLPEAREAALDALEVLIGEEAGQALRELLPQQAWRDVLDDYGWWFEARSAGELRTRERFALHSRLIELIGEDHAGVFMELLPPVPWRFLPSSDRGALQPRGLMS